MEPLRRSARNRTDLVGPARSANVSVVTGAHRGTGTHACVPAAQWPLVGSSEGDTEANSWASAIALNTLMILGPASDMFVGALDSLLHRKPLEASWLVRLKFRIADRQVRLDPTKFGWPWGPDTMSWVEPKSTVLIALERARAQLPRTRTGGPMLYRCSIRHANVSRHSSKSLGRIQDTSTIALAALAVDPETANDPLEIRSCAH